MMRTKNRYGGLKIVMFTKKHNTYINNIKNKQL